MGYTDCIDTYDARTHRDHYFMSFSDDCKTGINSTEELRRTHIQYTHETRISNRQCYIDDERRNALQLAVQLILHFL
jgi:hypothetical protein